MNKYAASAGHNRPVPPEASLVILFGILSSRNVFQLGVLPYSKQRIDTQAATGCDWILETVCLKRIDTLAATGCDLSTYFRQEASHIHTQHIHTSPIGAHFSIGGRGAGASNAFCFPMGSGWEIKCIAFASGSWGGIKCIPLPDGRWVGNQMCSISQGEGRTNV